MKSRVYLAILLLIIPVQAALFGHLSLAGIKPDLALALIYIIGLLTGPTEAALAGMAVGLVQDVGGAGLVGIGAFTRGLVGLGAGFLGQKVLDIAGPANVLFLAGFSLLEGILIAFFFPTFSGAVQFFGLLFTGLLPQALYTGILGTLLLRFVSRKSVMNMVMRRSLLKE